MNLLVAMSGGVDSSVAALLLRDQGHHVVGVTMCLGVSDAGSSSPKCCGQQGIADARRVCDRLGISHRVLDYAAPFQRLVVDPFLAAYREGCTPNPCVWCNQHLKFGQLLSQARAMGFEGIATGHYARTHERSGRTVLSRARDEAKDQTYFLYGIPREALASIHFPLADLTKSEVRALAGKANLPVAQKEESQDICFVDDGSYRSMLGPATTQQPGEIVDREGHVLGHHSGIGHFTVGQRKGLRIAARHPWYVVRLDVAANRVVVGEEQDLYSSGLTARNVNLLAEELPPRAQVKIRYAHAPAAGTVQLRDGVLTVCFDTPQKAVTPGQSVVLYDGDDVLGGGVIAPN